MHNHNCCTWNRWPDAGSAWIGVESDAEKRGYCYLVKSLEVTTTGYWASHQDFGLPSRLIMPTLLGGNRAADIIVNVILPFTFAWSKYTSQPELAENALDLYNRYSRLITNAIEKHMNNQLGLNSDLVDTARRQQGLIHIYRTLCSQGKCGYCALKL